MVSKSAIIESVDENNYIFVVHRGEFMAQDFFALADLFLLKNNNNLEIRRQ